MKQDGLLNRWIRFNGVGAMGIAVQLVILAWLVRVNEMHYLSATAIAVEATVLHNFLWHQRWTWKARRSRSIGTVVARLARFHLLNGAISMLGNLAVMRLLAGSMSVDPVGANIIAIMICSVVNFGASEWLVFRRLASVAALVLAVQPAFAAGANDVSSPTGMLEVDLQTKTIQAWNAYEQRVDTRYDAASPDASSFFALDTFKVPDWRSTALRGGVAMARIDRARPEDGPADVPEGKIHHWAGAVFVPNTSVAAVLNRLSQLAGTESKFYEEVVASRLISRDGEHYKVFLKLRRSKYGVDATYNSDHAVAYRRLGTARAGARSVATRIAQVDGAGTPGEREMKVGSDSGYLWRLNAYWRYEAVNNGVLIECESVSLSRAVPALLRPFISGVVEGLARESLDRTLSGLRKALGPTGAGPAAGNQ